MTEISMRFTRHILALSLTILSSHAYATEEIRLAQNLAPISGVVLVAEQKDFFAKHDLKVTVSNFTSGRAALQALLGGGADVATVAESPITGAAFNDQPVALLARINISDVKTLTRTSSGINALADLKGKRIAYAAGTGSEVYTATLLKKAGLSPKDVTLINVPPQDMAAALSNGSIDAYDSWEPHITNGKKALGAQAKELDTKGVYGESFNVTVLKPWLASNAQAAKHFLAALIEADEWIKANHDEAITIIAQAVTIPRDELAANFGDYHYDVTLDDQVLATLTAHASWRLESGNAPQGATALPDLASIVFADPLRSIASDRVKVSSK